MKRALQALFLLIPMAAYGQVASPFTFYITDATGTTDTPLPAAYQVPETPVGGSSPTMLKMVNSSQNTVSFIVAFMGMSTTSLMTNPNFSVTELFVGKQMPPGDFEVFAVNFAPRVTGSITSFLNIEFLIEQNGCSNTSSSSVCPGSLENVSTLTGMATAPQWALSYQSATGPAVLWPSSASPLNFPNISVSTTSTITFTLTNPTSADATTPALSLPSIDLNAPSAFTLDTSAVPATIAAGQSANFSVTFAPGQTGYAGGILQIGSNSYPIAGEGIIVAPIDALLITYTDSTGVRTSPQGATPITFPQVVPGSGTTAVLAVNVLNPITATGPVTLDAISITTGVFSVSNVPATPIVIAVGESIDFNLTFAPTSSGSFTGILGIGTRVFSLSALGVSSPICGTTGCVPGFNLTLAAPIASQQQAILAVQVSAPVYASIGTIALQFTPSVAGATDTDDPAIAFVKTAGLQLGIDLAQLTAGSEDATYNGEPNITFQTGTTAGTVTFTLAFADTPPYTQSFTIPATKAEISSVQAVREASSLVVTMSGYDNTYTAGELSFSFYDTTGKAIGSPIQFNAASDFKRLFFTNNTSGGLFSLQASFPVMGDVTQVGSVTVGVSNSLGQTTGSATFQ